MSVSKTSRAPDNVRALDTKVISASEILIATYWHGDDSSSNQVNQEQSTGWSGRPFAGGGKNINGNI